MLKIQDILEKAKNEIEKGECVSVVSNDSKKMYSNLIAEIIKLKTTSTEMKNVGVVFKKDGLFSDLTVFENLMLAPRKVNKLKKKVVMKKITTIAQSLGISEILNNKVDKLSDGQRIRVEIARLLAMDINIILLEQPTMNLSSQGVNELIFAINEIKQQNLILIASDDARFIKSVCDKIFFIEEDKCLLESTENFFLLKNTDSELEDKVRAYVKSLYTIEAEIKTFSYDSLALNAKLETFCKQNGAEAKTTQSILIVSEEVIRYLFERYYASQPSPNFCVSLNYDTTSEQFELEFSYAGMVINPLLDKEVSGMIMVNNIIKSNLFGHRGGKNCLKMAF